MSTDKCIEQFLRDLAPGKVSAFTERSLLDRWLPVDWFAGSTEASHLLCTRFWYKFLHDEGLVPTSEPFLRHLSVGHEREAGPWKSVIDPDPMIVRHGADAFRLFTLSTGCSVHVDAYNDAGSKGFCRFLDRVWALSRQVDFQAKPCPDDLERRSCIIRKVGQGLERMKFHTAVSALMEWTNDLRGQDRIPAHLLDTLARLLFPFAPHLAEEMWGGLGHGTPLQAEAWPLADPDRLGNKGRVVVVQVNGKTRGNIRIPLDLSGEALLERCLALPAVASRLDREGLAKIIQVPGRIINLVGTNGLGGLSLPNPWGEKGHFMAERSTGGKPCSACDNSNDQLNR